MSDTPDRIEQHIHLAAPRSRVWQALTQPAGIGAWFQATVAGTVAPGQRLDFEMTYPGYEGMRFFVRIDAVEPEHLLAWYWHPGANPAGDEAQMTHVAFHLSDAPDGGTLLRVVETGFERIDLAVRAQAFRENTQGWAEQLQSLKRYAESA